MYLLDANVFIQAKNVHYGFDFCPAFWDWIDREHAAGNVASVRAIADELAAGQDDLSTWAAARPTFFHPTGSGEIPSLRTLSSWASAAAYDQVAVSTFLQAADYYLVAHAHAHALTVVTHEVPSNSPKRIKIPDACIGNGVRFTTTHTMLRTLGARFVLGT